MLLVIATTIFDLVDLSLLCIPHIRKSCYRLSGLVNACQYHDMQCLLQVLSEALTWMATAIQEFGLKQLDVKQLIEWMKADVNSTSAPVRTAAIALLGTAHRQLGPGLDPLLSQSVKPALMQTLRDAFKANPVEQVAPHTTEPSPCACHLYWQQSCDRGRLFWPGLRKGPSEGFLGSGGANQEGTRQSRACQPGCTGHH